MFVRAENLWIVQLAGKLADQITAQVKTWSSLDKRTIGAQIIRAADSIGANIVEGFGRHHPQDSLRFFYIARGSLEETRYFVRRAAERGLWSSKEDQMLLGFYQHLSIALNAFVKAHKERNHLT